MTSPSMDVYLETAAKEGNEGYLQEIQVKATEADNGEAIPDESYFLSQTDEGDNILHLATGQDRRSFIEKALQKIPAVASLICQNNFRGQNPIHIAAQLGHLETVQVLVNSYKTLVQDPEGKVRSTLLSFIVVKEGTSPEPWVAQDSSGDTPLHKAMRNGYEEVALYLLQVEPRLANYVNDGAESILYLAAAYGHEQVLEMILTSNIPYSLSSPSGLTPLHTLIHNCTEGVAKLLLEKHPELAKSVNKHKQTALHYAAVANKVGHVEAILKTDKSSAYIRDENGLTPLHIAAIHGQLKAVRTILLHCPESIMICDVNGKTVLHLIKMENYQEGIEMLKTTPDMEKLVNIPDSEGNTPLHLAVKNSEHIKAKVILDTDKTGVKQRNKEGHTPWDSLKLQEELSENMAKIGYELVMHSSDNHTVHTYETQAQLNHQTVRCPTDVNERMQKRFSTIGLIAGVLAAVTFVAGFLIPGGFDSSGRAVLTRDTSFKVFILSNTTAMCGYTFVLISALWAMMLAQRDDEPRYLLSFSIHILQLSFYTTLIAFVSSLYALTSATSLWLAIVLISLPPCAVLLTISKTLVFRLARFFSRIRIY